MEFDDYDQVKARAYRNNAALYKLLTEILPLIFLKIFFPVIGFIKNIQNKDVLDVGSGTGLYSYILKKRFDCACIEAEPFMTNLYGSENKIIRADITGVCKEKKYDVILLIDVIEHLDTSQVDKTLDAAFDLLKPSGSLYVKVPNAGALSGLESCYGDLTHQKHYNEIALTSLLTRYGFNRIRIAGISPNLSPKRMFLRLLSMPFDFLIYVHLISRGCSGVILAPSIMGEFRKKQ